jgi:hypothetical protein
LRSNSPFRSRTNMACGYLLDTNVFNHVLRDGIDPDVLADRGILFATYVQYREINATKNESRRCQLE